MSVALTRVKRACLLALACGLASGSAYATPQLKLYPVPGLFMSAPDKDGDLIHPAFKASVPAAKGGQLFEAAFRQAFPDAATAVADKDKRRTLVTSLQVARASFYSVDKIDGTSDLFFPVSGSLYFTNAVSGEVLYTVSATYYHRATVSGAGRQVDGPRLQAMFASAYQGLLGELVRKAGEQFKPHVVAASVKREWNGLYILDHGQDAGIARGDELADADGNTLDVVFSAPAYAVASAGLGKPAANASFSRETNQTLSDIKKPRVMVLVGQAPDGYPKDILRQVFTDLLGDKAPVSVVHVNPLFANVLATAFSNTGLSSENGSRRELPDYFIRLGVPESRAFEMPTSLKNTVVRSYRTVATAELVDRSGRVLYAATGEDRIDDNIVAGMGFDTGSRHEVSVKNALLALAQKIGKELKFERTELPLAAAPAPASPLSIKDPNGVLASGENLTLFRAIGKVDGIAGEVRVPYLDIHVTAAASDTAAADADMPLTRTPVAPAAGDVVLLDTSGAPRPLSRRRFAACGAAQQLGAVQLPAFGTLAFTEIERNLRAPFYSNGLFGEVRELLGPDTRFKSNIKLDMAAPDYCIEPVYRVDAGAPQCGGEPRVCTDSATARITLRLKKGDAVVAKSALETRVTGSGYLERASAQDHQNSLATDLLDASTKLARDIAVKLNNENLN
jgi:hypothetical protein